MEIEAVRMPTHTAPTDPILPVVAPSEIAAFNQALFGHASPPPEMSAITQLQSKSREVNSTFDEARDNVLDSPLQMMAAQSKMLHAMVEVDLIAKTAGGISQGVNKLVSMQ
ncbi:type III secretion system inner rod subunit SctI [Pseudomonas sp. TH31]|uniref:type III secretion system inner rod subunit SctI n=1 Tax=Pseudomonas sp. TH31 TaxID=2796396 RepID=UPI001912EC99|nr:type III secretion system inner rod subunit SctI [Pseudomonas sp. TH31]MBK5415410.1 type III secretion system inner rod subunit SctI [Pseudomonas sp. TH31]